MVPFLVCNPESDLGVDKVLLDFLEEVRPQRRSSTSSSRTPMANQIDVARRTVRSSAIVFNVKTDPHVGKISPRAHPDAARSRPPPIRSSARSSDPAASEKLGGLFHSRSAGRSATPSRLGKSRDRSSPSPRSRRSASVSQLLRSEGRGAESPSQRPMPLPNPMVAVAVEPEEPRRRAEDRRGAEQDGSAEDPTFTVGMQADINQLDGHARHERPAPPGHRVAASSGASGSRS